MRPGDALLAVEALAGDLVAYLRDPGAAGRAEELVLRRQEMEPALAAVRRALARDAEVEASPDHSRCLRLLEATDDLARERVEDLFAALEPLERRETWLPGGWWEMIREELEATERRLLAPLGPPPCPAGILGRRERLAAAASNGLPVGATIERAVEAREEGRPFLTHLAACAACARELGGMVEAGTAVEGRTELWRACERVARGREWALAAAGPSSHPLRQPAVGILGTPWSFACLPEESRLALFQPGRPEVPPPSGWWLRFYRGGPGWPAVPRGPCLSFPVEAGEARWPRVLPGLGDTSRPETWDDLRFWLEDPEGRMLHVFSVAPADPR